MSDPFRITPCPVALRPDALRLLHEGLEKDQQMALVHAIGEASQQPEGNLNGLFVAIDPEANDMLGAVWVQLMAGSTAFVWYPIVKSPAAGALLKVAADFVDQQQVALAQTLINPAISPELDLFSAAGFQELATLAYLTADRAVFPNAFPDSELQFESRASEDSTRLGKLLLSTYQGTLDCPDLNGVRNPEDVLAGYRSQGSFSAERWFFVRRKDVDIGALILTEHANSENWELVYMGVTPDGRGKRFGWQIVQFAFWQAGQGGAQRLVLAVDEANKHALSVYRKAGFEVWDRKKVFVRLIRGNE